MVATTTLLPLLLGLIGLCGASDAHPTGLTTRLAQRGDFGVKVKVAYTLRSPESAKVEVCLSAAVGCDADEAAGLVAEGGTCGGYPNGCGTLKMAEPDAWIWAQKTIGVQTRVAGGVWSEPVRFRVDPSVRGEMGVASLERAVAEGAHGEL